MNIKPDSANSLELKPSPEVLIPELKSPSTLSLALEKQEYIPYRSFRYPRAEMSQTLVISCRFVEG